MLLRRAEDGGCGDEDEEDEDDDATADKMERWVVLRLLRLAAVERATLERDMVDECALTPAVVWCGVCLLLLVDHGNGNDDDGDDDLNSSYRLAVAWRRSVLPACSRKILLRPRRVRRQQQQAGARNGGRRIGTEVRLPTSRMDHHPKEAAIARSP